MKYEKKYNVCPDCGNQLFGIQARKMQAGKQISVPIGFKYCEKCNSFFQIKLEKV
jgi:uncharacterized protein with PIN domain